MQIASLQNAPYYKNIKKYICFPKSDFTLICVSVTTRQTYNSIFSVLPASLVLQCVTSSTELFKRQGCLFFKKIWIIPQHNTSSAKSFPPIFPQLQSYRHLLTRGIDPSLTFFEMIYRASQSQMPTWMYGEGGVWGGMCPPEKLENFVFLKLELCNLVNTFGCKFRAGNELK